MRQTEELASVVDTVRGPVKIERELEEFVPEIGGDRKDFSATKVPMWYPAVSRGRSLLSLPRGVDGTSPIQTQSL